MPVLFTLQIWDFTQKTIREVSNFCELNMFLFLLAQLSVYNWFDYS